MKLLGPFAARILHLKRFFFKKHVEPSQKTEAIWED